MYTTERNSSKVWRTLNEWTQRVRSLHCDSRVRASGRQGATIRIASTWAVQGRKDLASATIVTCGVNNEDPWKEGIPKLLNPDPPVGPHTLCLTEADVLNRPATRGSSLSNPTKKLALFRALRPSVSLHRDRAPPGVAPYWSSSPRIEFAYSVCLARPPTLPSHRTSPAPSHAAGARRVRAPAIPE